MAPLETVLAELREAADPARLPGMARVGIRTEAALGVSIPSLQKIARHHRRDHDLALGLWQCGIHEARILAAMVDDPQLVSEAQAEQWVADFDSWDLCDGVCDLFRETPFAWHKAYEWCGRDEEFVRRAGFVVIARMAVRAKGEPDARFLGCLGLIHTHAGDDRNAVKKAVNWALRQIGKRNLVLNGAAIEMAETIRREGTRSGRWIAADALRELRSDAVQARLTAAATPADAGGSTPRRPSSRP